MNNDTGYPAVGTEVRAEDRLPFGTGTDDSSSSDLDSEIMGEKKYEEKDQVLAHIHQFMEYSGTPIVKDPVVGNQQIDLYKLFVSVQKLGGYNRVSDRNQWMKIALKIGYDQGEPDIENLVQQAYKKFLYNFQNFNRKLGCTMLNHAGYMYHVDRRLIRYQSLVPGNTAKNKPRSCFSASDCATISKQPERESVMKTILLAQTTKSKVVARKGQKGGKSGRRRGPKRSASRLPKNITMEIGDELDVFYGDTKDSNIYKAKVLAVATKTFLVHYVGWNSRYDEWIERERIAENLSWMQKWKKRSKEARHVKLAAGKVETKQAGKVETKQAGKSKCGLPLGGKIQLQPAAPLDLPFLSDTEFPGTPTGRMSAHTDQSVESTVDAVPMFTLSSSEFTAEKDGGARPVMKEETIFSPFTEAENNNGAKPTVAADGVHQIKIEPMSIEMTLTPPSVMSPPNYAEGQPFKTELEYLSTPNKANSSACEEAFDNLCEFPSVVKDAEDTNRLLTPQTYMTELKFDKRLPS